MKQYLSYFKALKSGNFVFVLLFLIGFSTKAQKTWNGSIDSSWDTPNNWTPAGVPAPTDDVTIPNTSIKPIVSSLGSVAKSVNVQASASLEIGASAELTINGFQTVSGFTLGFNNVGTVHNYGKLTIGSLSSVGTCGIRNLGAFNNHSGAQIKIDQSTSVGIYNTTGTFINEAKIDIGSIASIGQWGIDNSNLFNNNIGGEIKIDRYTDVGLFNFTGTFNNEAIIIIASIADIGTTGLRNQGDFNNQGCEALLSLQSNNGTIIGGNLSNSGTIVENAIGTSTINTNTGLVQNLNGGTFTITNNTGTVTASIGHIWKGCTSTNWFLPSNWQNQTIPTDEDHVVILSNAINLATVSTIGAVAKSVHVQSSASLTIDASAELTVNGFQTISGYITGFNNEGTINNNGKLTLGSISSVGDYGLYNSSIFNNNTGGEIQIDNSSSFGLWNFPGGTFTNIAKIIIGSTAAVGSFGLTNQSTFFNNSGGEIQIDRSTSNGLHNYGTFTNEAKIAIGSLASIGGDGLLSRLIFNNIPGGEIYIDRASSSGLYIHAGTFTNSAKIIIGSISSVGSLGVRNLATFNNNGCTALINVFSNSIIAGGTLTNSGTIIENSTANSTINTNTGFVQNLNGGIFTITNDTGTNTNTVGHFWKGCTDSDWFKPANWHTISLPNNLSDVLILNSFANQPIINTTDAVVKSLYLQSGASIIINNGGHLSVGSF